MNICSKWIGGVLELVKGASSGATRRGSLSFTQGLPSITALICWIMAMSILLFTVSGCGREKKKLESTKAQVDKLSSEVNRLTQETDRLNQEKICTSGDLQIIADKNVQMQQELERLRNANTTLSAENKDVRQKIGVASGKSPL